MKLTEKVFNEYIFFVTDSQFTTSLIDDKYELGVLDVDLDFETFTSDEDMGRVDLTAIIENSTNESGYRISVECQGFFSLTDEFTEDDEKVEQCLLYTCLPMVISSMRAYIKLSTTYMPFGSYTLPAISLKELFKKKFEDKSNEVEHG